MTRSRQKNRANKRGNEEDIKGYKKQKNLVFIVFWIIKSWEKNKK